MTSHHPTDDRETLCALFDGQLQGDAARFALKRLGHDARWRQACGRWQLYGDVLRGQAHAVADGGFADRVASAIAQEPQLQAVGASVRGSGARRGWIGGALAASVAVAALFVTRPFSDEPAPAGSVAPSRVATAPTAPRSIASTPGPAAPIAPSTPQTPDPSLGLSAAAAAAAVAAVEVPRRAVDRRASRGQSQRATQRTRQNLPAVAAAGAAAAVAIASTPDAVLPAVSLPTRPFAPQHVETTSRPWPRAVLPQYSGGNAMSASFGPGTSPASPSFYPFEPQPTAEAEATASGGEESPRR